MQCEIISYELLLLFFVLSSHRKSDTDPGKHDMAGSYELLQDAPCWLGPHCHQGYTGDGGWKGKKCHVITRVARPTLHLQFWLLVLDQAGTWLLPELGPGPRARRNIWLWRHRCHWDHWEAAVGRLARDRETQLPLLCSVLKIGGERLWDHRHLPKNDWTILIMFFAVINLTFNSVSRAIRRLWQASTEISGLFSIFSHLAKPSVSRTCLWHHTLPLFKYSCPFSIVQVEFHWIWKPHAERRRAHSQSWAARVMWEHWSALCLSLGVTICILTLGIGPKIVFFHTTSVCPPSRLPAALTDLTFTSSHMEDRAHRPSPSCLHPWGTYGPSVPWDAAMITLSNISNLHRKLWPK